jgi:gas vesicle protein
MRFDLLRRFSYLLTAALLVPVGLLAAPRTSAPATQTADPSCHSSPSKASLLLNDVQRQADQVKNDSSGLDYLSRENNMAWQFYAFRLTEIKSSVNQMGKDLHELEAMRGTAQSWQEREANRILPRAWVLADQTQAAIKLLNHNQLNYWATALPTDLQEVQAVSGQIDRSVRAVVEEAHLRNQQGLKSQAAG